MKKLLVLLALVVGTLGAQTEVRRVVALPSYKDLKFPPLPPLKIPEPATYTLPNGMRVYLLEDHGSLLLADLLWFAPAICSIPRTSEDWRR